MSPTRSVRPRALGLALASACALIMTGCSGTDTPDAAPSSSAPAISPTVEPTPEETPPTDGVVDLSDEEAGILFTGLPDVSGDQAAVLTTYMTFEKEIWYTNRNVAVSDTAAQVAAESAVPRFMDRISVLTAAEAHLDGTITFSSIQVDSLEGDTASVSACTDQREIENVYPDRTVPAIEDGASTSYRSHASLARHDGTWMVVSSMAEQTECV